MTTRFEYVMRVPEVFLVPLREKLEECPGLARNREKYLFVLHLVARQLSRAYKDARVAGAEVDMSVWHCRLHSRYLQAALGNDYLKILQDLEYFGFIRRSNRYKRADAEHRGICKAVWFPYPYTGYWYAYCRSRDMSMRDMTGETRKCGRTRKFRVASRMFLRRLEACAVEAKDRALRDARVKECHESLEHFSLDRKKAAAVLGSLVASGALKPARKAKELEKVDRFNSYAGSPTALFVKKDRFGRIHTNVTQLKKEVRSSCLYCDGKETAGVDIRSSQGAFLGAILRGAVDRQAMLSVTESAGMNSLRRQLSVADRGRYLAECDRYDGLLMEGRLYEFFADELSADFDLDRTVGRDEAKREFFKFVFGPVHVDETVDAARAATRRVWAEHFPLLLAAIERMKAGNYAALAREMQRVESDFIFNRVVPRIRDEIGCPFCTVHDSIIVAAEHVREVDRILGEELAEVGIPTLTVEEFAMQSGSAEEEEFEEAVRMEMLDAGTLSATA